MCSLMAGVKKGFEIAMKRCIIKVLGLNSGLKHFFYASFFSELLRKICRLKIKVRLIHLQIAGELLNFRVSLIYYRDG